MASDSLLLLRAGDYLLLRAGDRLQLRPNVTAINVGVEWVAGDNRPRYSAETLVRYVATNNKPHYKVEAK